MATLNSLIKVLSKTPTREISESASKSIAKKIASSEGKSLGNVVKTLSSGGTTSSQAELSKLVSGASMSGAGGKLGTKSGSTLEGVLGKTSGVKLPNAKKKTLQDYGESSIGSLVGEDLVPKDLADVGVSSKTIKKLKSAANEGASLKRDAFEASNASNITNKSNLPKLNREQYYYDTIGKVRNGKMSYKDVPEYMNAHLSNAKDMQDKFTRGGNDEILRELFQDESSSLSELYDKYDELARAENSNLKFTGDNIDTGLMLGDEKTRKELEQDIADTVFGNKKNINVESSSSGSKKINVDRQNAELGEKSTITDTETAGKEAENMLRGEVNGLKEKMGYAGGYRNTNGVETEAGQNFANATADGFKVKLKNGENIDISLKQPMSKDEIKKSRAIRNLDDKWAKGLNATTTQYKDVVAKSKSAYKGYKTPAEMARMNGITLDNISTAPQRVLSALEDTKTNIEKYAEDNGVDVRLDNLDLSNIEPATKATMKMQGIDPDKIKYTGLATPTEAETLYKDLRNRAVRTTDGDRAVAYNTMADYVRKQIDNTLDNLNIDFSYEISNALGKALGKEADLNYLRDISNNKGLKFSDLRKEQADWIKIGNLSGRPIKENPTINLFGVDTGVENPFTAGADKIKEKIYEKQAYGNTGGAGFGESSSPTGTSGAEASGAENNINFNTAPAGQSRLQSLLSKGKDVGLVGAGMLGGLLLGGNGNGGSEASTSYDTLGSMLNTSQDYGQEQYSDPYKTITLGGYTYDQLEQGYVKAMSAGDTEAASMIKDMLDMLTSKIESYNEQEEKTSSSSTSTSAKNGLNALQSLYNLYQQAGGSQGYVQGNITNFLNQFGGAYNKTMATYESLKDSSTPMIARALGEKGVLSDQDRASVKAALPSASDDPETAERKFMALYNQIMAAANE